MPVAGRSSNSARLAALGVMLPAPPQPLGHYVTAVRTGHLLVLSGMLPLRDGKAVFVGRVGETLTIDAGRDAAWLAALNALAVAAQAAGSVDRIRRVVRVTAAIATAADFTAHAAVADGASDLFASIFEQPHTRVAVGAYSLPAGATIELDVTFELTD